MRLPAILSTLAVFAASAVPAFPQFRFATTGRCAASGAATIDVSPVLPMTMIPVTGSPYSAVATDKSRYEAVKWRDSAGRVRTEIRAGSGGQPAPCNSILVQIEDPVAGYSRLPLTHRTGNLNPQRKVLAESLSRHWPQPGDWWRGSPSVRRWDRSPNCLHD